ncbi:MAG: HdeA/HdeB family chaperone [Pseudomonadota bacterium]
MKKYTKIISAFLICISVSVSPLCFAEVYGGGYWEAIGLGNIQCSEFSERTKDEAHKELGAVWLSGFMSGVNFSSKNVYDITWGEDIYVLTDLLIKHCNDNPEKYLSDIATQMVYNRYKDKNYSATKDMQEAQ